MLRIALRRVPCGRAGTRGRSVGGSAAAGAKRLFRNGRGRGRQTVALLSMRLAGRGAGRVGGALRGEGPGSPVSRVRFAVREPKPWRRSPCGAVTLACGTLRGRHTVRPAASGRRRYEKSPAPADGSRTRRFRRSDYFTFGPAATRFLPSSLPVNFVKFFTKRLARSSAFVSHSLASL